MKANKFISGNWKIFSLIFVGSLLYAGFTQMFKSNLISQVQKDPLDLGVDVIRQLKSSSCGEAMITVAYNYAYPLAPIQEQEVIDYAISNGYYTEDLPPYTSPSSMVKIAKYYADDVSSGTVTNSDQGLILLIRKLQKGEPIIIDVLSNFKNPQSEAHFVIVTGISVDQDRGNTVVIHYNDPFTGGKESADWLGREGVWNAWQNNDDPGGSGWWLVISPHS
jgi:hypothetical protein